MPSHQPKGTLALTGQVTLTRESLTERSELGARTPGSSSWP